MTAQGYQLIMGKRQINRISNGNKTQGFKLGCETRDGGMRVERGKYVSEGLYSSGSANVHDEFSQAVKSTSTTNLVPEGESWEYLLKSTAETEGDN